MKTQYRIISKPSILYPEDPDFRWYVAQYKFLNLFWDDCVPDPSRPGFFTSMDLKNVERFVEALIADERLDLSNKVVKEYQ